MIAGPAIAVTQVGDCNATSAAMTVDGGALGMGSTAGKMWVMIGRLGSAVEAGRVVGMRLASGYDAPEYGDGTPGNTGIARAARHLAKRWHLAQVNFDRGGGGPRLRPPGSTTYTFACTKYSTMHSLP